MARAVFDGVGRGDFEAMGQFPVPPSGVEPVLDELIEAGVGEDAYTLVLSTETVVSQRLSALVERFRGTARNCPTSLSAGRPG